MNNISSSYSWTNPCGASVLAILHGGTVDEWVDKILKYRNSRPRYRNEFTRYYGVNYKTDRSSCYLKEMMYFTRKFRTLGATFLKKQISILELSQLTKKSKTNNIPYILATQDHFIILYRNALYDNQWYNKKVTDCIWYENELVHYIIPLDLCFA